MKIFTPLKRDFKDSVILVWEIVFRKYSSVLDPDPKLLLVASILIRIGNADPDPGGQKWPNMEKKKGQI